MTWLNVGVDGSANPLEAAGGRSAVDVFDTPDLIRAVDVFEVLGKCCVLEVVSGSVLDVPACTEEVVTNVDAIPVAIARTIAPTMSVCKEV